MPAVADRIGAMLERLTIQRTVPPSALTVSSLTRSGDTATATTLVAHGYASLDYVTIADAVQSAYNGTVQITVTSTTTFTFSVSGSPATPATGAITVTYASDAQGGRRETWRTVDTVSAALMPLRGFERLQAKAMTAQVDYRFRVRVRADLSPAMRVLWTPRWPPSQTARTLQIASVQPVEDGRMYQVLECGEVQ